MSTTEGAIKQMKLIKNAGSNLNKSRTMIKKDQCIAELQRESCRSLYGQELHRNRTLTGQKLVRSRWSLEVALQ